MLMMMMMTVMMMVCVSVCKKVVVVSLPSESSATRRSARFSDAKDFRKEEDAKPKTRLVVWSPARLFIYISNT